MKYRRAVNRRLDDTAATGGDDEMALIAQCWPDPDGEPLPRVVQRNGQAVFDEGWVVVDDEADADPDLP